jgi:PEGA domain
VSRTTRFVVLASAITVSTGAMFPEEAQAQRRAVPRTHGRSVVVAGGGYHYPYYYPYFYPYYYGFYGGFYPAYWGLGFGWGYPYPPYRYPYFAYDNRGSARVQVTPRNAQVFIDGYYVGLVDDFDGYLQRLHVEPGEHELQIYLEGYRTIREKVLSRPGATLKVAYTMQPLATGEPNEPRPAPDPNARTQRDPTRAPGDRYRRAPEGEFGTLSLRIQPGDATVIVDGQAWDRPAGEDRFVIDLPEGTHELEVRKEGFKPYTRTIQVRRGQTLTLNVSLSGGTRLN